MTLYEKLLANPITVDQRKEKDIQSAADRLIYWHEEALESWNNQGYRSRRIPSIDSLPSYHSSIHWMNDAERQEVLNRMIKHFVDQGFKVKEVEETSFFFFKEKYQLLTW